MIEKEYEYPTKEIIEETLGANFNLNILEKNEERIVFEDRAVNFVNGYKEKFIARTSVETEKILDESVAGSEYGYLIEEIIESLPLILRIAVERIIVDMNEESEYECETKGGVITFYPIKIAHNLRLNKEIKLVETEEYIEFDEKLIDRFSEVVTMTLFENLSKNPIFFGEIETKEIDYKKFFILT